MRQSLSQAIHLPRPMKILPSLRPHCCPVKIVVPQGPGRRLDGSVGKPRPVTSIPLDVLNFRARCVCDERRRIMPARGSGFNVSHKRPPCSIRPVIVSTHAHDYDLMTATCSIRPTFPLIPTFVAHRSAFRAFLCYLPVI